MLLPVQKIEFRQKRAFGELLNASFAFLKQNIKPILRNLLFIAGPFILVGSVLPGLLLYPWVGNTPETGFSNIDITNVLVNVLAFIVGTVMAITSVYEYMLLYMKSHTGKVSTTDVWKAVRNNFFNVLFSCISLVILFAVIIGFFGFMLFSMLGGGTGAAAAFFIVFFGSIYLTVVFSPLIIVRLAEKENIFTAIARCFKLMEGKWWQTFLLLFVCYIIQSAIVSIVFIPFYAFMIAEVYLSPQATPDLVTSLIYVAVGGVILVLTITVSFCLTLVVTCFQYFSLVEDKDNIGLLQRIGEIGTPVNSTPSASDFYEEKEDY